MDSQHHRQAAAGKEVRNGKSGGTGISMPTCPSRRYIFQYLVGRGAYGEVYRARDSYSGRDVAVKHIRNVFECPPEAVRVLRELKFLRLLRGHPNIVQILDVLSPAETARFEDIFIILEYLPATLRRAMAILSSQLRITLEYRNKLVKKLAYDLLCGLSHMHAARIYHRDLKPDNLLVMNTPSTVRLCICDFGLARAAQMPQAENFVFWTGYVETRWYRAPELLLCHYAQYSTAIDIWSAGCILAEMLSGGRPLFAGKDGLQQLDLITQLLGKPDPKTILAFRSAQVREYLRRLPDRKPMNLEALFPGAEPLAIDLLRRMLYLDPSGRLTAAEAVAHPYFDDVDGGRVAGPAPPMWDPNDFCFERAPLDSESLRGLFRSEIGLHYHPETFPSLTDRQVTRDEQIVERSVASAWDGNPSHRNGQYEWPSELDSALEQIHAKRIGLELRAFRSLPKEKILQTASRVVQEHQVEEEMSACVRTMSQRSWQQIGSEVTLSEPRPNQPMVAGARRLL
jgi:serine/threonine protein kinase